MRFFIINNKSGRPFPRRLDRCGAGRGCTVTMATAASRPFLGSCPSRWRVLGPQLPNTSPASLLRPHFHHWRLGLGLWALKAPHTLRWFRSGDGGTPENTGAGMSTHVPGIPTLPYPQPPPQTLEGQVCTFPAPPQAWAGCGHRAGQRCAGGHLPGQMLPLTSLSC